MSFRVVLHLQITAEKLTYPALPFHVAQHNPRLAHLRTDIGEKERQRLQNERHTSMGARLEEVAEYIQSLGYSAQRYVPKHRWDIPKPDNWSITGGPLSSGGGILPVSMLSPQRPLGSAWAQEFKLVVNSVVREYSCKVTSNRMMQASVVGDFQIEEIKRLAKLFCIFEDIIDDLEFESELATSDKLPPVESVRRNRVLQDMDDDAVMEVIHNAEDVSGLRMLLVPYIDTPGLSYASTYKMHLLEHTWTTEIVFNNHPTTTCGDTIVRFMELMVKFVQYALDHDDETVETCEPTMEIFFDEIIRDEKLAQHYDPRRSRTPQRGVMSRLSSPASSLDSSHTDTPSP